MKFNYRVQVGPKQYLQTLAKSRKGAIKHLIARYGLKVDQILSIVEFPIETIEC